MRRRFPATIATLVPDINPTTLAAADDARAVIARLRDAGVLTKASGRQRYVAWVAPQVTSALDAFAERARRG